MTRSLTKLALSLVIATSVTAVSFAKGDKLDELEGSGIFQNSTNFDVSVIFDNPAPQKLDDSFNLETIAQSKIFSFDYQDDTGSFLGGKPKSAIETAPSVENELFNSALLEQCAEQATRANEEHAKAQKRAANDAYYAEENRKVNEQYAAHLAALAAPSALQVFGGYAYTVGEVALGAANYAARTLPGAFFINYANIRLLEEGIAYTGYVAATGLTAYYSGGNMTAAQASGNGIYYGIKGGFTLLRNIVPGYEGIIAALCARDSQVVINAALDVAPVVVNGAISVTTTAANAAYSAATTTYSAASSAASYIRSFWG